MTKKEIVDHVVNNTTLSRSEAITATEAVVGAICKSLRTGESVFIRGFATIKVITTAPKTARNISTGATVAVPAKKSAKLVLCKDMKNLMNK